MKRQNYGPHLGKLIHQLLKVITLAYDLRFAIIIPRFKYLEEDAKNKLVKYFETFLVSSFPLKTYFSLSKRLKKLRTQKLPKIVKCATIKENEKLKETMVGVQVE